MSLVGQKVGHIRLERLLGAGGMGEIYAGLDEVLGRRVAVKVLHDDRRLRDEAKARFRREARMLSRLDHPGICRIHDLVEGGEVDYLVLELVDGVTLRTLAEPGLERRRVLELVAEIADALAAAHDEGIVHRDLKPDNVMVTAAGVVKLLDFGIARAARAAIEVIRDPTLPAPSAAPSPRDTAHTQDWPGPGAAVTIERTVHTDAGWLMGTVRYMSPEQAAGSALTTASDLYSLGIMLQELLTGESCYGETRGVELLLKVYRAEAAGFHDPDPVLEQLVARLKSIDPADRPGAKATAAALRTVLDRPRRRRARRARLTVAAAAAVTLLVAAGIAVHARLDARRQAEVAQRFASRARDLGWTLRAEQLAPEHDISRATQAVRVGMQSIAAEMATLGRTAIAPGEYALGRCALALGQPAEAAEHLMRARAAGNRSPEVAAALGLAFAEQYRIAVNLARTIPDAGARASELERLARELQGPAIELLASARGSADIAPDHIDGVIALLEERWDEAAAAAERLAQQASWRPEAPLIAGRAELAQAYLAQDIGNDLAARELHSVAAIEWLHAARAIGRSDPAVHLELCRAEAFRLRGLLQARRLDLDETALARVRDACERVLVVDPSAADAVATLAVVELGRARLAGWRGEDPEPAYRAAIATTDRALELDASNLTATQLRGYGRGLLGWHLVQSDPAAAARVLEEAVADYEHGATLPGWSAMHHLNMADSLYARAAAEVMLGGDPTPWCDRGLQVVDAVRASTPTSEWLGFMEGNLRCLRGRWAVAHGGTAADLERAAALYRELAARTENPETHRNLAVILTDVAGSRLAVGDDPTALLDEAVAAAGRAREINAGYGMPQLAEALAHASRARWEELAGGDAEPWFERAVARFEEGLELAPYYLGGHAELATIEVHWAAWRLDAGGSPEHPLTTARRRLAVARTAQPDSPAGDLVAALADVVEGRWRTARGLSPRALYERALMRATAAHSLRPEDGEALAALALVRLWRARAAADDDARRSEAAAGLAVATTAVEVDPSDAGALGRQAALASLAGDDTLAAAAWERALVRNPRLATTAEGRRILAGLK